MGLNGSSFAILISILLGFGGFKLQDVGGYYITGKVEVATIFGKFVGHGTDAFEGQKIKGDFVGSVNNYQIEITIQATITSKIN